MVSILNIIIKLCYIDPFCDVIINYNKSSDLKKIYKPIIPRTTLSKLIIIYRRELLFIYYDVLNNSEYNFWDKIIIERKKKNIFFFTFRFRWPISITLTLFDSVDYVFIYFFISYIIAIANQPFFMSPLYLRLPLHKRVHR